MKKVLLPLFAAAMLTACSNEDMPQTAGQGGEGDNVEIKMSTTALDIDVKKPFDGDIEANNSLTARVVVSETTNTYAASGNYSDGTMIFTTLGQAEPFEDGVTGERFYPAGSDDTNLFVRGFYPSGNVWTLNGSNASATIDGKSDLMVANEQTTNKGDAKDGSYPALTFNHLLTKLIIKVQAADVATVDTEVNKIELVAVNNDQKIPTTCTLTYNNNDVAFSGEGTSLAAYKAGTDNAYTGQSDKLALSAAEVAYILCPPVTASTTTADYKLKITYASEVEQTVDIELKKTDDGGAFTDNTAGYAFTVTLNFKATEIKATATVTNWKAGGETTVDVE